MNNYKYSFLICLFLAMTACKVKKEPLHSVHVSSTEGKVWNVFGVKIVGKILSEDTQGKYSVIVTKTPAGGGPPKHVHKHEDELFYILKGIYTFYCGKDTINANKGDYIKLPKGIPHYFKNTDTITGITMNTITPGGFENFFEDVASLKGKLNKERIDSLAQNYGIQFIKD